MDRAEANRLLAKAIANKNVGKYDAAKDAAIELIKLLQSEFC